jgi:5-methyltetrahydropteroyltriglutamate--homocysteine methyltransferase
MARIYRADQVGSLLRPPELLAARDAYARRRISEQELRDIEDRSILNAIRGQEGAGIGVFTDGELRRGSWLTDMAESVEGFVPDHVVLEWKGPGGGAEGSTANTVGAKLHKLRKLTGHEVPFLKAHAPGPFKVTLPAPSNFLVASYKEGLTDKIYPTHGDLLRDLVAIVEDEVRWLAQQGVPYIQFDGPYYSHYLDPQQRERMKAKGIDPDRELGLAIEGDNAALRPAREKGLTTGLHVCRGNSRSRWYTEGGYDAIAERLFGSLDADTFLLEYDSERSGSFEPLRLVPRGKNVVLGLVTTKQPQLESEADLTRRIHEAARFVPLENLAISTQCGFASVAAGNLLTMDQQWRKLELVVSTARKVWGESHGAGV